MRMIEALLKTAHEQYLETELKQRLFAEGYTRQKSWTKQRKQLAAGRE